MVAFTLKEFSLLRVSLTVFFIKISLKKAPYLNGGKMSVPFAMTSLRPCKFLVMSWSVWYHSMVGGGSPRATHSNRAPELLGNRYGHTSTISSFSFFLFHSRQCPL